MKIICCGYDYRHPKGFQIDRPTGSGDYVLLVLRSSASFVLQKETVYSNGNAVILFNKGTPQLFGSYDGEFVNDWVHFECDEDDIDFIKSLGIEFDSLMEFQSVNEFSLLLKMICSEKYSNNKNATQTAETLLHLILLKFSDSCEPKKIANSNIHKLLTALRNDIFSNPQKNWRIDEIAQKLFISRSYLQHQYKLLYQTSIMQDVTASRIEHSKYLLFSSHYTISEIAALCGYENSVHFMRTFKKETGLTPTEYKTKLNFSDRIIQKN